MAEYKIVITNTYRKDEEKVEPDFWKKKKLEEMKPKEWELLCDGCGKCCLNKLDLGSNFGKKNGKKKKKEWE